MKFIKENKIPLLITLGVALLFGAFLYFTFVIAQPGTFLSSLDGDILIPSSAQEKQEKWKIGLLTENFVSLFSSGVSLSMIAPDIGKIATHPSIKNFVEPVWPAFEIAIFILNIALFWVVLKYALKKEKIFIVFLMLAMFITIFMVVLARPDHNIIPDFDYRYAGPPYYFYCLFIALVASIAIKIKKEYAAKIIVSVLIVIFALQQIFSFHAVRLEEESKLRKEAIVRLNDTLFIELERLSEKNNDLTIPNLTGAHIFQGMPGYTLADYLLFFDKKMPMRLVQNIYMPPDVKTHIVDTVENLRTSTSQEFKDTLKKTGIISSYYTSSVWMRYKNIEGENTGAKTIPLGENRNILIKKNEFDPEKSNTVGLSFYTDDIPGNLEFYFSFKNDFGLDGKAGAIRIDDFTPYIIENEKRLYHIETNMLQIYAYALSDKVSELFLYVPKEKNPVITNIHFK
ncbi:MAG: hypothetical protein KAR00_02005 [Candidatus Pacebacteria bacterium]|nr:hypothetical protein [Candidatus Paceibacterota bacterium]